MGVENVLLKQNNQADLPMNYWEAREASQIQSYEQPTWKELSSIGKSSKRRKERMQLDQGSPLNSSKEKGRRELS